MNSEQEESFGSRVSRAADLVGGIARLAAAVGVSSRMISEYAAGRSEPARDKLVRIARAAGVRVAWLATGEGEMLEASPIQQLLTAAARELGGPIDVEDVPREAIVAAVRAWWRVATPKQRAWLEVELERHFPELAELKKNLETSLSEKHVG